MLGNDQAELLEGAVHDFPQQGPGLRFAGQDRFGELGQVGPDRVGALGPIPNLAEDLAILLADAGSQGLEEGIALIQKPYTRDVMLNEIRRLLDE